jgi:hypothetical protein
MSDTVAPGPRVADYEGEFLTSAGGAESGVNGAAEQEKDQCVEHRFHAFASALDSTLLQRRSGHKR